MAQLAAPVLARPDPSLTGPGEAQVTLSLEGMTCAACTARVTRVLTSVPGVRGAEVNLANETALIRTDPGLSPLILAEATGKAGYPVRRRDLMLEVEQMTCASCVARLERAIGKVPGVVSVSVNLASDSARVEVLEGSPGATRALIATVLAAAKTAGYPARERPSDAAALAGTPSRQDQAARRLMGQALLAGALALPVFATEMGGHLLPGFHHTLINAIGLQNLRLLQMLLTALVLLGPGRRFFTLGFPALWRGSPDMNSLVALGTSAAFGLSAFVTLAPDLMPTARGQVYFEAAAVIVVLILLGRALEARAKGRTGDAIRALMALAPRTALVERGGQTLTLPVAEVRLGDVIRLHAAERVATDAVVIEGESFVDESMITGEPMPVAKRPGDPVTGGTLNGQGTLRLRVTRVGEATVLAQIVAMVEAAQATRLPVQALVDRVTLWFVPAVLGLAALTGAGWLAFGPEGGTAGLSHALVAAISVLVVACPCAMGLAVPTSIMVGSGRAAELGVLFRQGRALQGLQAVRTVAFDKTGTLTEGQPRLTDILPQPGITEDEALSLLAAAEAGSEHPSARAILQEARARGLTLPAARGFAALPGRGIRAEVEGLELLAGTARLMTEHGITLPAPDPGAALAQQARSPIYLARGGRLIAIFAVADQLRPEAPAALAALRAQGLRLVMLTGDRPETAAAIGTSLGLDDIQASLLPAAKLDLLKSLRAAGPVAFVGDGMNDAPALAEADVGIAIGTGTDVAISAADVVLMSGDLGGVVRALAISRATLRNIRQNLFWAFGYNILLIPVAAGLFDPLLGLTLTPAMASGAMALSSLFVLGNALRLRWAGQPARKDAA